MSKTIDAVIQELQRDNGVPKACAIVEAWAREGRCRDLEDLALALEERCEPGARASFETLADHVEDQLALTAGPEAVDALLALSAKDRSRSIEVPRPRETRLRAFASRLGYGQTADELRAALERKGEDTHHELFACWMHEVVLRGTSLARDVRAARFQAHLAKEGHPLARLPLELRDTEREAPSYLPLYGDKGLGRAIEALEGGPMSARTVPPPADGAAVRATRVDDEALVVRMREAVLPWTDGTKGKAEAKVFELAPAVEAPALGSWLLRALPLESTTATARLDVARVGPEAVFGQLFAAASNGGAYSSGLGGAYGRLAAWASLGALVGAEAGADVAVIDELASRSAFLTYRSPGPWFYDVAWDLGALVLRPDGRSVAVLAATDSE